MPCGSLACLLDTEEADHKMHNVSFEFHCSQQRGRELPTHQRETARCGRREARTRPRKPSGWATSLARASDVEYRSIVVYIWF
ncbi:hypothetical protein PsYK624_168160 [Phanerochaete sordida]|uniref:Uncharacterized protein n=1 Tax=Phanerochaete sordida TaxID=48140 RepID=A0A9P3GSU3_9APHY|nr:hypothetical protein PsYK624_168160 [Phanerochaete sordida]